MRVILGVLKPQVVLARVKGPPEALEFKVLPLLRIFRVWVWDAKEPWREWNLILLSRLRRLGEPRRQWLLDIFIHVDIHFFLLLWAFNVLLLFSERFFLGSRLGFILETLRLQDLAARVDRI